MLCLVGSYDTPNKTYVMFGMLLCFACYTGCQLSGVDCNGGAKIYIKGLITISRDVTTFGINEIDFFVYVDKIGDR